MQRTPALGRLFDSDFHAAVFRLEFDSAEAQRRMTSFLAQQRQQLTEHDHSQGHSHLLPPSPSSSFPEHDDLLSIPPSPLRPLSPLDLAHEPGVEQQHEHEQLPFDASADLQQPAADNSGAAFAAPGVDDGDGDAELPAVPAASSWSEPAFAAATAAELALQTGSVPAATFEYPSHAPFGDLFTHSPAPVSAAFAPISETESKAPASGAATASAERPVVTCTVNDVRVPVCVLVCSPLKEELALCCVPDVRQAVWLHTSRGRLAH